MPIIHCSLYNLAMLKEENMAIKLFSVRTTIKWVHTNYFVYFPEYDFDITTIYQWSKNLYLTQFLSFYQHDDHYVSIQSIMTYKL